MLKTAPSPPPASLSVYYMFYHKNTNADGKLELEIFNDSDYNDTFKQCVKSP